MTESMVDIKIWFYTSDPDELTETIRSGFQRMKDEDDGLKPCPFCGGEAHSVNAYSLYFVKCTNCQAESKFYSTEAEAIAAWNARAERICSVEETCFDELWQEKYTRLSCGHYVWGYAQKYCPECGARIFTKGERKDQ